MNSESDSIKMTSGSGFPGTSWNLADKVFIGTLKSERQPYRKAASLPQLALNGNFTTVGRHNAFDDGQSETASHPGILSVCLIVRIKDKGEIVRRNAITRIDNVYDHFWRGVFSTLGVEQRHMKADGPASGCELHGIG